MKETLLGDKDISVVRKGGFSEFRRALPDNALEQTSKMLRILKSEVVGYDSYIVGR